MLVTIYQGTSLDEATLIGDMHFESRPGEGDQLEINRAYRVVNKAWHMPNAVFAGAKFAVLVSNPIAHGRNIPEPAHGALSAVPVARRA
jgi:hypothetical protein